MFRCLAIVSSSIGKAETWNLGKGSAMESLIMIITVEALQRKVEEIVQFPFSRKSVI